MTVLRYMTDYMTDPHRHDGRRDSLASDAASRGYDRVLEVVAKSVGVRLIHLPAPELAQELLQQCLLWRAKRKHEHCWGSDGTRFGEADHPGPESYTSIKRGPQLTTEGLASDHSAPKSARHNH